LEEIFGRFSGSSPPCLQQGQLEHVAQVCVLSGF